MIRRSVHGPGSRETALELRSCSRRYRRCGGGGRRYSESVVAFSNAERLPGFRISAAPFEG
jgi:hypothetical protein